MVHTKDRSGNRLAALREVADTDQGVPLRPLIEHAALAQRAEMWARPGSAAHSHQLGLRVGPLRLGQRTPRVSQARTDTPHDVAILELHSRSDAMPVKLNNVQPNEPTHGGQVAIHMQQVRATSSNLRQANFTR